VAAVLRAFVGLLCLSFGVTLVAQEHAAAPVPAQVLVSRAADYVERFAGRVSGIVVEEAYNQDVIAPVRLGYRANLPRGPVHRTLRSDLLLVRPSGSDAWMQFRDVFEVDGRALRDRSDRLQKIFLTPSKTTAQQAERIVRESARYNIGEVERTMNLPFFPMAVLDRNVQRGFSFRLDTGDGGGTGVMALPTLPDFAVPEGAVVIAYDEIAMQTLIRTPQGRNLATHGRFWLRPDSGEVLMTELRVDDWNLGVAVHVTYRLNEAIGVPLPVAMHEVYENKQSAVRVEGLATYSNFREFSVKVDEQIAPIK
jgi:hypothetical protein